MALGPDNLQAAKGSGLLVQLNIRTTARHVGGNSNGPVDTGVRYDLRLQFMEFCIQNFMGNAPSAQHAAEHFRSLDGNGTYQNRLSLLMSRLDLIYYRLELFFLCLIYCIIQIHTGNRLIRRNCNNVHAVNIPELLLLSQSRTGHTGLLREFIKEVLEGNGSQSPAFPAHIHMFLCLNGLVKSIGIPSAGHDSSGKLINDQYLVILYHVILIPVHQIIGTESQYDIVLNLQVLRICQVLDVEEFLHLFHALLSQVYHFILLIYNIIAGLFNDLA